MARSAPRRRLDLPVGDWDEEGSWTKVGSGRGGKKRRKAPTPSAPYAPPQHRQYRILKHQETSDFQALRRLERSYPNLRVRVLGSSRPGLRLQPSDEESAFFLARLVREKQFGMILEEVLPEVRGVVLRYPLSFSIEPIQSDRRVAFAKRCTVSVGHGRIEQTRQVQVTFRGSLPESLDLGPWGVYSVRSFTPEPLRCYKCHAYGHVQKYCERQVLCGVCSGRHSSSVCTNAMRNGERPTAHCPNCGQGHHAWSKSCPERLRRLPPGRKGRDTAPPGIVSPRPQPEAENTVTQTTASASTAPKKRRRRRKKRSEVADSRNESQATPVLHTKDAATETLPLPQHADAATEAPQLPAVQDAATEASPPRNHVQPGCAITFTWEYFLEFMDSMNTLKDFESYCVEHKLPNATETYLKRLSSGNFSMLRVPGCCRRAYREYHKDDQQ